MTFDDIQVGSYRGAITHLQYGHMLTAGQVPDPRCPILAPGNQLPSIRAEGNATYGLGMTLHHGHALSTCHVPHPRRPVLAAGRQLAPIVDVCHACHYGGVTLRCGFHEADCQRLLWLSCCPMAPLLPS